MDLPEGQGGDGRGGAGRACKVDRLPEGGRDVWEVLRVCRMKDMCVLLRAAVRDDAAREL